MAGLFRPRLRPGPAPPAQPARRDDGAVVIEFVFVLPILLLILFTIVDMGRLLQQNIQLTQAAREAARLGALYGTVTDVKGKVTSVVGSGVTVTYPVAPTLCTSASAPGSDAVVTLTRTFQPATPMMGLIVMLGGQSSTVTMRATGVMACVG